MQVGAKRNIAWKFGLLTTLMLLALALNISLGSVLIPLKTTITYLTGGELSNPAHAAIIESIRLPKAITAILAGASLAIAGLGMQTLFRNPLADPFVLGINSGASLGVALVVLVFGATGIAVLENFEIGASLSMVLAAAIGAGAVLLLVLMLSRRMDMMTLLILGLMIGYLVTALVSIMMHLSSPERLQSYLAWTFGDLGNMDKQDISVYAPCVGIALLLMFACAKSMNAMLLGETYARSLGVSTGLLRAGVLIAAALLAGATTAFCGPIGFIGVAVPHLCRGLLGVSDHRLLMPACLMAGATTLLLADVIAQVPGSYLSLPLNAITALIGAPVIIYVLLRGHRLSSTFAK